ncbi:DinB family protein [Dictyobacter aurantiacus]|uniref:DinB-like domain-containing protein n=1 Tax=Dictyobacter aurantiacus TaxID=1936993 RepID=A0A401ZNL2_9CHLR|nr:DinB family protein [Dictyobacter aurantiacus]GCE08441.1 hypothetical protein KDAU_57700 [Dictyobacter aurantiacus]
MVANRVQLIDTLEQTHQTLVRLAAHLSDAELDFRPDPEAWSTREILAHLVDDEMFVMRTRLERMVKEENPVLASHDEKKWYRQRNTARDAVDELLSDFAIQRAASLGILRLFRAEEWERTAYHPEYNHFTTERWVEDWIEHDHIHIRQIENNSAAFSGRS